MIIKFFVGTELGVANFLQRHFDWYANSLWYEEIPNARDPSKTRFFLGGKDAIVNAHVRDDDVPSYGELFLNPILYVAASEALSHIAWHPQGPMV